MKHELPVKNDKPEIPGILVLTPEYHKFTHLIKINDCSKPNLLAACNVVECDDREQAMYTAYKFLEQKLFGFCFTYIEDDQLMCYIVHQPINFDDNGSVNFHLLNSIEEVTDVPILSLN